MSKKHRCTFTTSSTSTNRGANGAATLAPTVRIMIVAVPDELPGEALTNRALDQHFNVQGTLTHRFWAIPSMWVWQRSQLVDPRKGHPVYCAGGPARLLNLDGMRHAAGVGAAVRYQLWSRVVHGTRPATPWTQFLTRHLADPYTFPRDTAIAAYNAQPRVNAIRMHNAVTYGAGRIDLCELEMFQAGCMAYQHYSASTALAGDTVLTTEGHRFAPASDAFADRVTFLEQTNRYFGCIDADQRLLAVTV
ncbi:hypothetical protein ACFPIJ_56435 [Dactylosporangium cerinum]|uniref:Uncharacterized protein n=1 Tax=Dactylosporangium cerinum TaxID=1434730 RepID=A0ABV9WGF2_9ACTN